MHTFDSRALKSSRWLAWSLVRASYAYFKPAHTVRGPKYLLRKGKTPEWSREDAKRPSGLHNSTKGALSSHKGRYGRRFTSQPGGAVSSVRWENDRCLKTSLILSPLFLRNIEFSGPFTRCQVRGCVLGASALRRAGFGAGKNAGEAVSPDSQHLAILKPRQCVA